MIHIIIVLKGFFMDISNLLPLLLNAFGGNTGGITQPQTQNQIPQNILASYPSSYIDNKAIQNAPQQQNSAFSPELLKNLMPMLQNIKKTQKNSSPKFSELKSIDEYEFD